MQAVTSEAITTTIPSGVKITFNAALTTKIGTSDKRYSSHFCHTGYLSYETKHRPTTVYWDHIEEDKWKKY